ncbi:TPA: hypothetical protein NHK58_001440 [Pseudomonas aeruginosa]|nr:hypothetical protein [Pseudomonas aeruginosa]
MEGENEFLDKVSQFGNSLNDMDLKREFEELGIDLVIKSAGEAYSYRIYAAKDNEYITYFDTGKLTVKDEVRGWKGISKSSLEEMYEYNKSTLPVEIRLKTYNILEGLKHLMDTGSPIFQEIERRKYNLDKIKELNLTERATLQEDYKNGKLINIIENLGMFSNFYTGGEMNDKYQTKAYEESKNYMILPLSIRTDTQIVITPDNETASGFNGKIVSSRKGYSSSIPLAEIGKLDKEKMRSVVDEIKKFKIDQIRRIKKLRGYEEDRNKNDEKDLKNTNKQRIKITP